jgi:voltage-gated potassium channel
MSGGQTAATRKVRWRHRTYEILEQARQEDPWARWTHIVLVAVIIASVIAAVFETVPALADRYKAFFSAIEAVSVMVFLSEYVLRLWSCVEYPPLRHMKPWKARLTYARTAGAIVDLLTILPFLVALTGAADMRALAIFRLVRFLKLARYSPGIRSLAEAVYTERRALVACLVILGALVIATASVMHLVESSAQPDRFGTIPDAMWWAIVTLTTVGYGDVVPITPQGKVVAALTALLGLVMLALPVGIVATAFSEVIHRRDFVVTWGMIARVPLFGELKAEEVAQIMRLLRSRLAVPGEVIVRRGEVGHSMYFIATGQVEIETVHGRKHQLGEGQFFGEVAVLRSQRRSATVRALVRTQLLVLEAGDLRTLMLARPDIGARIDAVAQSRAGRRETVLSAHDLYPDDDNQYSRPD